MLDRQQKSELAAAVQQARCDVMTARDVTRDQILERQEEEIAAVLEESASLAPEILVKKQEELRKKHNRELEEFDSDTQEELENKVTEVTAERRVEFSVQALELKEKQLVEMSQYLRELTGQEDSAAAKDAVEMARQAQEQRAAITR